ncbi:universal stress protein [Haloarcula hispanica N601]|uniref:Universal stress protein n=3 Tax=Haloarcula hispanica TaxID=51589 RepID=V5TKY6_HALHI|nr:MULTISPECIES: universal stress protein [Haloarcula]AEM56978.1 universal stress protein [Haloarcula hispanica ATCC 33960]AHB65768.1 universal stress protein [Haloarcula hispanica N601]KAA9409672.1 universal stress protein [Haloarcula hispanica]KZX48459.1 universal stress protein [Haloarcula sp. K1]
MFDRILVPTDGSPGSERAFEVAATLASTHDAAVHVLSVVDEHGPTDDWDYDGDSPAEAFIESQADHVDTEGLSVTTAVREGVVHDAVLDYGDENEIDLIVMGTHGRTGVRRFLLGSVTEKVVRLADVPVLSVKADAEPGTVSFDDILLPTDGSSGAEAAIEPTGALASATDATVHLVSVVDTRSLGIDVGSSVIVDELESVATDAVGDASDRLSGMGVETVETAITHGVPYRAILDAIEEADADLVVIGTHGRTGIDRYLLGSVAEKLVRTSPVPVMTVRAPDAGDES